RVRDQLLVKFVAEHDDVLELRRKCSLIRMLPAVPDLRFAHEIESTPLDYCGLAAEAVRSEEDRCAEDALKRANQTAIFLPASVHAEALQHFGRSPESDCLALLLDR